METGYAQLLDCLWRSGHFTGRRFSALAGEAVDIVAAGEYEEREGVWPGAEIIVNGERRRGCVIVGDGASDTAILRVVGESRPPLLDLSDRLIPQIEYHIDRPVLECYDGLRSGAGSNRCGRVIAEMDSLRRTDLFTKLLVARLERKCGETIGEFESSGGDWNQAFYAMLLRAMGGNRNGTVFAELASRVRYLTVAREKSSPPKVEALLLGASGFLYAAEERDSYTLGLENEFRHLANKHSIIPLKPAQWDLDKTYPRNHPAIRLAEIAALLSKRDFLFDTMLACRNAGDLEDLFCVEASEYWKTHCKPGAASRESPKRIGKAKAHLVGINLAVPLIFAYGKRTGNENMCEGALDLLESIPAEKNGKLDGWAASGCLPTNSFESQAILELNNGFCIRAACARCPIGRWEIKKALPHSDYAINS